MIDNNTYRNFGMLFVDSGAGLSQSSITPRPLGVTKINTNGGKIKDRVWQFTPPEISNSIQTATYINGIADNASGISSLPAGKRSRTSVTEIATNNAIVEEKNNDFKESINICFEDLGQLYADTICMNLTTPRKVKIYDKQEITLNGVTKENFKGITFICIAQSAENATEARALKQKAAQELFQELKDDPQIPNQKFLRENLMHNFGLTEDQIGKAFEVQAQPPQPEGGAPLPNEAPQGSGINVGAPGNPAGPALAQVQQMAQTIRTK